MKKKWSLVLAALLFLCYYIFKLINFAPKIMISGSDWGKYLATAVLVLAGIAFIFYLFYQQKLADKFKGLIAKYNVVQIILFFVAIAANVVLIFFTKFVGSFNLLNLILLFCVNYVVINLFLSPKK